MPPRTEIEHGLAVVKFGDGGGVAAAQAGQHRVGGQLVQVGGVVLACAQAGFVRGDYGGAGVLVAADGASQHPPAFLLVTARAAAA